MEEESAWDHFLRKAIEGFEEIKKQNNLIGLGNSHVISDDDFMNIANDPYSIGPFTYLKQLRMKIQEYEQRKDEEAGIDRASYAFITPVDFARGKAVLEFQDIKYQNDSKGFSNAHLISNDEFVKLSDPYLYLYEIKHNKNPTPAALMKRKNKDDDDELAVAKAEIAALKAELAALKNNKCQEQEEKGNDALLNSSREDIKTKLQ